MSTMMASFLQQFDPVARAAAAANNATDITATYSLYKGEVDLLYDAVAHSYFVRRKGSEDVKRCPSVTNITGTLDKPALVPWAVKLAAEEILAKVEEHSWLNNVDNRRYVGLVPFEEFTTWVTEAKREYKRVSQEALDIGHIAHDWLEELQKSAIQNKVSIKYIWESGHIQLPYVKAEIEGIAPDLQTLRCQVTEIQTAAVQNCCREAVEWMIVHNFRPLRVENKVLSLIHNCAGTFDTIGLFDSCAEGECCTILNPDGTTYRPAFKDLKILADWKSSKGFYNEYRFQTAAYKEFWLEEHGEVLGGRVVVKMPKTVGDKFAAYFLSNEDQAADFAAFAGLLVPYQRIEALDIIEKRVNDERKAKARAEKEARKEQEESDKVIMRQARDAERAKKKADEAIEEQKEAEAKAARLLEACPYSGRYKGLKPPNCNDGKGCTTCRTKYEAAQAAKGASSVAEG